MKLVISSKHKYTYFTSNLLHVFVRWSIRAEFQFLRFFCTLPFVLIYGHSLALLTHCVYWRYSGSSKYTELVLLYYSLQVTRILILFFNVTSHRTRWSVLLYCISIKHYLTTKDFHIIRFLFSRSEDIK